MNDLAAHQQSISMSKCLLVAMELSKSQWRLELAGGLGGDRRRVSVPAWDRERFERELARAKQHFGLDPSCGVVSCYEAGPDGFSVHRYLMAGGIESLVVDGASCEVNRRQRRAKTDRLDAAMLMNHLERHLCGQPRVWRVVRVPTEEAEDRRHLHRELETLLADRVRIQNRIRSLLLTQGLRVPVNPKLLAKLEKLRRWDGSPLPPMLCDRLERECLQLGALRERVTELKRLRQKLRASGEQEVYEKVLRFERLRSIGEETAWRLVMECFGSRNFQNRREVGAYAGLAPTPYNTGRSEREQGIGKDGNRRLRTLMIEAGWNWLRWQPQSALSQWFEQRFGVGGKRSRRIGMVALARKLLVALWRYIDHGVIPEGAILKA